jgi:uncharacterized protein (DUF302 family)
MRMLTRGLIAAAVLLVPCSRPADAASGLVTRPSPYGVVETIDRLEAAARERGLAVIARVDHAAAAQRAGLVLRPTQLLVFGNPRGGTPLMQSAQPAGIDLPLKALAWEDERGQVWLGYNEPRWIAERHGVVDRAEVVSAMASVLAALAETATRK